MELDSFRPALDEWLDAHEDELRLASDEGKDSLAEQMTQLHRLKGALYDAGWMRWGWPERGGGYGGSSLLRAYLGEAVPARNLAQPGIYSMTEVLAPTMIDFAPPALAAEMIPR